jgi:hypothetical protein
MSLQNYRSKPGSVFVFIRIRKKKKRKAVPVQAWTSPQKSRRLELPEFLDNRHM